MKLTKTVELIGDEAVLENHKRVEVVENYDAWNFSNDHTDLKIYLINKSTIYSKIAGVRDDAATLGEFRIYKDVIDYGGKERYDFILDDGGVVSFPAAAKRMAKNIHKEFKSYWRKSFHIVPEGGFFMPLLAALYSGRALGAVRVKSLSEALDKIYFGDQAPVLAVVRESDARDLKKKTKAELSRMVLQLREELADTQKSQEKKIRQIIDKLLKMNWNQAFEPQSFDLTNKSDPFYELFQTIDFLQNDVYDIITEQRYLNKNLEAQLQLKTQRLNEKIAALRDIRQSPPRAGSRAETDFKELDEIVHQAAHDLRALVASIQGLLSIASRESSADAMRQYVGMIADAASALDRLIRQLTNYSWNAHTEAAVEPVDLKTLVKEAAAEYPGVVFKNNDDAAQESQAFHSDASRIKMAIGAFLNELSPYQKSGDDDLAPALELSISGGTAQIKLVNLSGALPADFLEKINQLFSGENPDCRQAGYELCVARLALRKTDGRLVVQTDPDQGTYVALSIPDKSE